jgi:hypothetical protein
MKPNTLFQVRFRPSVKPPRGWTKSAIYNVVESSAFAYKIGNTWLPTTNFIKIKIEDAPVFDKPVLRKIASLKENECIEIPNDTIRDLILEQAEREGLKVGVGVLKPSEWMEFDNGINYLYYQKNGLWKSSSPTFNNHTILPASKFVEVPQEKEPETDWSKVPFPEGYVIEKETRAVKVRETDGYIKHGAIGTIKPDRSQSPRFYPDNISDCLDGDEKGYCFQNINKLAPLNATDHPNHPEFGKKKEEPITETQKDDCKAADERIKELENETITKGEQANVEKGSMEELDKIFKNPYMDERQRMHQQTLSENNKMYGQLETIKRLAKIAIQHEDYEHMRVILKSIATGEI